MTKVSIPEWAKDYPPIAYNLEQARLPFYCINCYRKTNTEYLTDNFGPLCEDCLIELKEHYELIKKVINNET